MSHKIAKTLRKYARKFGYELKSVEQEFNKEGPEQQEKLLKAMKGMLKNEK